MAWESVMIIPAGASVCDCGPGYLTLAWNLHSNHLKSTLKLHYTAFKTTLYLLESTLYNITSTLYHLKSTLYHLKSTL